MSESSIVPSLPAALLVSEDSFKKLMERVKDEWEHFEV
jgi:hypothetical protein